MKFIKWVFHLLLLLLIVFFGVTFTLKNTQMVELNYYFGTHWEEPMALFLLVSLIVGIFIGICINGYFVLKIKGKLLRTNKNIVKAEKELEVLRSMPKKEVI